MSTDMSLIREQAHYWYALYANDELDETARADFEAWRSADATHIEALAHAEFEWRRTAGKAVRASLAEAYPIDDLGRNAGSVVMPIAAARSDMQAPLWQKRSLQALAASIAIAASIWLFALFSQQSSPAPQMASAPAPTTYEAAIAETRTIDLADGSRVTLDATSRLAVSEFSDIRRVELLEGKALFDIAEDPSRPFVVIAGSRRVKVLGTVFDIQLQDGEAIVSVREGRVAIEPDVEQTEGDASPPVELVAYQRISFAGSALTSIEPIAVREFASWRDGLVFYTDAALSKIIADAARYSTVPITVDPALSDLKLTGGFQLKQRDLLLRQIEEILPVEAQVDNERVRLLPRK
ncbi:MAG: FecR domain-containing protein [Pseudomonadota bacterium]